ncbi:FadR/GntR family transcriptional regulator [Nitrincola tapanii]|uniref:Pyruvate dehydrogenase complex repressor n=1 Tax=Nitrincola tapanii TaxID=1708751 RepID=A0A5A9W622_9GAMM|nr:FadR/GntR family transcriptional regulator [Nitrincola tapanii]KAA0874991.1 FadR family transcriptional regulator [Nitrincola tapanii]
MPLNFANFSPQDQGLSQALTQFLQQQILFGHLVPGELLPSQRHLSAALQISRASVREALQQLEQQGVITTRPGGRSQVNNLLSQSWQLGRSGMGSSAQSTLQMLEVRAFLEGESAYYAALRATPEERQALALEYEAMRERSQGQSTLAKAKADLRFHLMIANASHHLLIISFSQLFYEQFFSLIHATLSITLKRYGRYPDGIAAQHEKIHRAIQQGEAQIAREVAREHILYTRGLIEAALKAGPQ